MNLALLSVDFVLKSYRLCSRLTSPAAFHFCHLIRNCNECKFEKQQPGGPEDSTYSFSLDLSPVMYSLFCLELLLLFSLFLAKFIHLCSLKKNLKTNHTHKHTKTFSALSMPHFLSLSSHIVICLTDFGCHLGPD